MSSSSEKNFSSRVWTATAIVAFVMVVLLLSWKAVNVFLLILAGAIIAVFFHGFAGMISRVTGLSKRWSLTASVLTTIAFLGGIFFMIGSRVSDEAQRFSEKMPDLLEGASSYVEQNQQLKSMYEEVQSMDILQKATPIVSGFFNSSFGFLGDLYVVIFIGIFFTATPEEYKKGMVKLLPARARKDGNQIVELTSQNLRAWLKGLLFSMLVVFMLTAGGLAVLGIDLWLILALIAGLLSFIPNFGPILAIIPAALVALSQSPMTALWVIVLYCVIQIVESNFITPLVQQELIKTPPALIIITQVFMGIWLGGWGIILAVPILVMLMVLVDNLYIKTQDKLEKNDELT